MKCDSCEADYPSEAHFAVPGTCLECFEKLDAAKRKQLEERAATTGPKQFDILVRQESGGQAGTAVKVGFCWPGLLFTWVWAFANRLWAAGAVLLAITTIFNSLFVYFSDESPAIASLFGLANAMTAMYVGFYGNSLRRARREAEGFRKAMTVRGSEPSQVLETLGIPQARSLAYSLGGVAAAMVFSAIAVFSVMVGSAMFIAGDREWAMGLGMFAQTAVPAAALWYRSLRPPLGFLKGLLWGGGAYLVAMPVLMMSLAADTRARRERSAPEPEARIRSLAVMPLENVSGEPEQRDLAEEMTARLASELAVTGDFERIVPYRSVVTRPGSHDAWTIARAKGVDAVLEGGVRRSESRIRLAVQLTYLPTELQVWADQYDARFEERNQLVRDVAAKISSAARASSSALGRGAARGRSR
jgi:TolB-like protein